RSITIISTGLRRCREAATTIRTLSDSIATVCRVGVESITDALRFHPVTQIASEPSPQSFHVGYLEVFRRHQPVYGYHRRDLARRPSLFRRRPDERGTSIDVLSKPCCSSIGLRAPPPPPKPGTASSERWRVSSVRRRTCPSRNSSAGSRRSPRPRRVRSL